MLDLDCKVGMHGRILGRNYFLDIVNFQSFIFPTIKILSQLSTGKFFQPVLVVDLQVNSPGCLFQTNGSLDISIRYRCSLVYFRSDGPLALCRPIVPMGFSVK